eukprot:COSAG02_NODE_694_length_18422_cov_19.850188_8_plen_214_part_00
MSETDALLLVSSQPEDLEDLANIDLGEWTVTNELITRVSISEVQKNAVTLPLRDDSMAPGDFEIGLGGVADDFDLMDGAVGFDDELQESGGFQLDDSQNPQNGSGEGMADFSLCALYCAAPLLTAADSANVRSSIDHMPISSCRDGLNDSVHMMDENELDKENLDPVADLPEQPTDYSVTDSAFIQIRTSTSNKKRRRSRKEPSIDEVTQISK